MNPVAPTASSTPSGAHPPPELLEVADSPEALLALFADRGWGDGLPLVPPTHDRVDTMLAGLGGLDPDEVIATLPPRFGQATRRIIAVNAVLAGCSPEHLPVLVTAVRALGRPEVNLRGVNATTHCVAPLLIVHGEIAREAGYNGGIGAFGPGHRANAATGRALRLILLHVAGAVPGPGDASTQGGPAKYSYCVAENASATPWEGYAASVGIHAASAVTVHCGEGPHNVHDMESSEPPPILDKVASAMASLGPNNVVISQAIDTAVESITGGASLAKPLRASGHFPPLVTHMVEVGEQSGELEAMLGKVADTYDEQVETSMTRLTALLEPMLILVMVGIVLVIIFATLVPMLQVTSSLK